MKETRADTRVALLQATVLHVLLFALMFAGLHWTRSAVAEAARGEVIEADLIDASALSASMRSALQRAPETPPPPVPEPAPEPLPEPVVETTPPPPPVPEPDTVEQERVQRDAESPEVAQLPVEQERKRTPPKQADLDARQTSEQERQRQLADIRRQLDQARREADMAEQKARQLADARNAANAAAQADAAASRPRGDPDSRSPQNALYSVALKDAITRQWTRPESVPLGVPCQVRLRQIPGGEVVEVQVSAGCPYDELGKRSLEAAVLKASPLPYAGFEDVFRRDVILTFRPEDVDDLRR